MINDSAAPSLPTALAQAQRLASQSRFDDFLVNCRQIIDRCSDDSETLLNVGTLLLNFGYLTRARECFASSASGCWSRTTCAQW